MPVPELDPATRRAAVEKATAARRERAALKEELRQGTAGLGDVLARAAASESLARLRVADVLTALPGYGPTRARQLMERVGIAASRRVRGLGPQQRAALLAVLGEGTHADRAPGAPAAGLIAVIGGPSGVGKGTVHDRVRAVLADDAVFSVSLTTRPARPGERDGVHYRFVDRDAFERAVAQGTLLEWTEYAGNLYGTPAGPIDAAVVSGKVAVLDLEAQGAFAVKRLRPDTALTIALVPPSLDELERRLRARGTEGEPELARRLEVVRAQLPLWERFDTTIVNDDLDTCVAEVLDAIAAARTT